MPVLAGEWYNTRILKNTGLGLKSQSELKPEDLEHVNHQLGFGMTG